MFALADCNNFFASCERVFRPDLQGKPVIVLSNNDGCAVARSNEAKALGIKMGAPFFKIRHIVEKNNVAVFSGNMALYGDMSQRERWVLEEFAPSIEVYSIDEAFLHLDGINPENVQEFCRSLVARVRQWVGIPVSIGVAPTKTLAKIASHFAKTHKGYRGVCMMDTDAKRHKALELTPIDDVWGIGRRLAPKMVSWGVQTALDFTQRPKEWVQSRLGVNGLRTWEELCGIPCVEEENAERRKSICTSRSFADMIEDERELELRVSDFAAMCAKKLRDEESAAYDVNVFMYTNRFREDLSQYFPSVTVRLPVAANSTQEIVGAALRAFRTIFKEGYQYKKAGVTVSNIVPQDQLQGVLFGYDQTLRKKQDRLSEVMDSVNAGSGKALLRLAAQREGHYADGIRCERKSSLYTTDLSEIIKVH